MTDCEMMTTAEPYCSDDENEEVEKEEEEGNKAPNPSSGELLQQHEQQTPHRLYLPTELLTTRVVSFLGDDRKAWNSMSLASQELQKALLEQHHHHDDDDGAAAGTTMPWPRMILLMPRTHYEEGGNGIEMVIQCIAFSPVHTVSCQGETIRGESEQTQEAGNDGGNQQPQPRTCRRVRRQLLACATWGTIFVIDLERGPLCTLRLPQIGSCYGGGGISSMVFSPNGKYLTACSSNTYSNNNNHQNQPHPLIMVWQTARFYNDTKEQDNRDDIGDDDDDNDQRLRPEFVELKLPSGRRHHHRHRHDGLRPVTVRQLGFGPIGQGGGSSSSSENDRKDSDSDNYYLWAITHDNTLWQYDFVTGQCHRVFYWGSVRWFSKLLAVGGGSSNSSGDDSDGDNSFRALVKFEGIIHLLLSCQTQESEHPLHRGHVRHSDSDNNNYKTTSIVLHDHANACGLHHFAFSSCGMHVVAGGHDGYVEVWNNVADSYPNRKRMTTERLRGLQTNVRSVIFSPDGKYVAGLDSVGSVMIWNIAEDVTSSNSDGSSCTRSHPSDSSLHFEGMAAAKDTACRIHTISFTPDSSMLVAAAADGIVRFWSRAKWRSKCACTAGCTWDQAIPVAMLNCWNGLESLSCLHLEAPFKKVGIGNE